MRYCEGLLDADYDIKDETIMPAVGRVCIDELSKLDYKLGRSHNEGIGYICDYEQLNRAVWGVAHWMKTHHKNKISKSEAQSYMWAAGINADADVCLICVVGDLSDPSTLGIGRPSKCEGMLFTKSTGYDNGKWVAQGLVRDSRFYKVERRTIYALIEGIVNNSWKRKFYLLPGYCYESIRNQILG